jgi:hypothetical protein
MQSFDEEDKDRPIIKVSSSHISDKSNVERTTNKEGNNSLKVDEKHNEKPETDDNLNEKKESDGDRDLLNKTVNNEALRNSNQTEKQNNLQSSQFRRTTSQPINPQLTNSAQLNSSQSTKNKSSPFKKMFSSSSKIKSNKNMNLEEKENEQESNNENDKRISSDVVDGDEFKKRIERRHYSEILKVLLKAGCCSPSDLDELKQLRYDEREFA